MAFFNEGLSAGVTRFGEAANSGNMAIAENHFRNGNFEIWQRGTSFNASTLVSSGFYTADRWKAWRNGSEREFTVSRQTASLTGSNYCIRIARNNPSSLVQAYGIAHVFPGIDSLPMLEKYVSISFWARVGTAYTMAGSAVGVEILTGTGVDNSGLPVTAANQQTRLSTTVTASTTWQRFTVSAGPLNNTSGTPANQIIMDFYSSPVGTTASANDYFEIAQVQMNLGAPAPFMPFGGSYGADYAECLRFYEKTFDINTAPAQGVNSNRAFFLQSTAASSNGSYPFDFKVYKRITPTIVTYSPVTTSVHPYNDATATNFTATTAFTATSHQFVFTSTSPSGSNASNLCSFHWTADAEL